MKMRPTLTLMALAVFHTCSAEVLVVAHRGASAYAPENTLEAFNKAWELGADAIEGDFHMTNDNRIVCIHDDNTREVSGESLNVAESDFETLRSLDVSRHFKQGYENVKMPNLEEVLASVPEDKSIFIELKGDNWKVPLFLKILESSNLKQEQIVILSFEPGVLSTIEKEKPDLTTVLLVSQKSNFTGALKPSLDDILNWARTIQCDGISLKAHPLLGLDYGERIHNAGYSFHVWTVDEPAWAIEMASRGAASITTNKPDVIRAALDQ